MQVGPYRRAVILNPDSGNVNTRSTYVSYDRITATPPRTSARLAAPNHEETQTVCAIAVLAEDTCEKVSTVLPLKDSSGKYLSAAMVIAFKTSPEDTRADTDFLAPGLAIRDGLQNRITDFDALFAPAQ